MRNYTKKFQKNLIVAMLVVFFALGLNGSSFIFAATSSSLGTAATYGLLGSTYTNTAIGTTITGNVGYVTGPAVTPTINGVTHVNDAAFNQAGIDQGTALASLNSQLCTFTFVGGAIDLSTDITHGTAGVYTPGVYCSSGAMDVGGPLTLNGSGTYIFRPGGALTSTAGAIITLNNVCANDVFWTPIGATTLAANTTFKGTVIDAAGITIGANTNWSGRALAFGGTVTTDADTIAVPTCATAATESAPSNNNTITVFKQVINDNEGTSLYSDFPLFINGDPVDSGQSISLAPGIYTITETSLPTYQTTFAGDCDVNGIIDHGGLNTQNDICTVVNNDIGAPVAIIPPLIHITKIPSPLVLPAGPGLVTYNYNVTNIGIVPMTNVTVTDNKCSPVSYLSGDLNTDSELDLNELWKYRCTMLLPETTTNTVTATGEANDLTATDNASATVVVGSPLVPPLIDLIKMPVPLFLPAGGGLVKYTYLVKNPGTVALSDVRLVDDKCFQLTVPKGDANNNNKLDPSETWTYSCQMNLRATTKNTAIATGSANGFTVHHASTVTVVVNAPKAPIVTPVTTVPKLPKTGVGPSL